MTLDLNNLSFGQYLKSARLQKGIELEVISKETRIGMENLRHIESEAHELLPAVAFVKGFLRAYAQSLGVDAEDVVQRYEDSLKTEKSLAEGEAELVQLNQRFWPRLVTSLGAMVILIALSIFAVSVTENPLMRIQTGDTALEAPPVKKTTPDAVDQTATQSTPVDANVQQKAATGLSQSPNQVMAQPESSVTARAPADASPQRHVYEPELDNVPLAEKGVQTSKTLPGAERLRLEIHAQEETWLQVTVDAQEAKTYQLQAGSSLKLEASSGFRLLVGNAGGITLTLNDHQLPPLGRSGQVRTVRLP
jgi:cytoskeleton protein RodZ